MSADLAQARELGRLRLGLSDAPGVIEPKGELEALLDALDRVQALADAFRRKGPEIADQIDAALKGEL